MVHVVNLTRLKKWCIHLSRSLLLESLNHLSSVITKIPRHSCICEFLVISQQYLKNQSNTFTYLRTSRIIWTVSAELKSPIYSRICKLTQSEQYHHQFNVPMYLWTFSTVYTVLSDMANYLKANMNNYIQLQTAAIFFLSSLYLKQGIDSVYVMVGFICKG